MFSTNTFSIAVAVFVIMLCQVSHCTQCEGSLARLTEREDER